MSQPRWHYHPGYRPSAPYVTGSPVRYQPHMHRPVYRRSDGKVSTGTAVATAIAVGAVVGVIGYQMGKNSNRQSTQNCKTVTIDSDQKTVCRDMQGNWVIQ